MTQVYYNININYESQVKRQKDVQRVQGNQIQPKSLYPLQVKPQT